MPQVPRLDGPQVEEQIVERRLDNTRPSAGAFGGGFGSSFAAGSKVAKAGADIFERTKERMVSAQTKDAENKLANLQSRTETVMKGLKGRNSLEAEKVAREEYTKGFQDIIKNYDDPDVQARVSGLSEVRMGNLQAKAFDHSFKEMEKYENDTHKSYIENMKNEGIENYKNPDAVAESLVRQEAAILSFAQAKGLSGVQTKLELEAAASKTHTGIIQRMVNAGEDLDAAGYLEKNKKSFGGEDLIMAEKLVESAGLKGESIRQADTIINGSANQTEALEATGRIKKPELRDEVRRRVKQGFSDKKTAERADTEELFMRALNKIEGGGGYDAIPEEDKLRMSITERNGLRKYGSSKRENISTDPVVFYDLQIMASEPRLKKKFSRLNLLDPKYLNTLSKSDWEGMVKLQSSARSGKGSKELDGFRTTNQIATQTLKPLNIKPDDPEYAQFMSRAEQEIKKVQDRTGKEPDNAEKQRIFDIMLKEVVTDEGFWFDFTGLTTEKKRIFQLDPGEEADLSIDDINPVERSKIAEALKFNGIPVTEDNIFEAYRMELSEVRSSGL